MSEEISINILKKEEVTFSLDESTTIQEVIEFLVEVYPHHFKNVPKQNLIIKSQSMKTLLPNQTLQQVYSKEKLKNLYVEINQQYENQEEISITFFYHSQNINCAIETCTTLEEILQAMKETLSITEQVSLFYCNKPLLNLKQTLRQQNLPNNCTIHLKPYQQDLQYFQLQNYINFVYENQKRRLPINISTTIDELLSKMKNEFQITEQFSLFYNKKPLLNLNQTLEQLQIPNNSTIELKEIKQWILQRFEQIFF